MNYRSIILNTLLDQYERSATFKGNNRKKQSFRVEIGKLFPKYLDDAEYDVYEEINEVCNSLIDDGYVIRQKRRKDEGPKIVKLELNPDMLGDIYKSLKRVPRREFQDELSSYLNEKIKELSALKECNEEVQSSLLTYCNEQLRAIEKNKNIRYYDDIASYRNLWKLLIYICQNSKEIYERDLSVRLYSDSKLLESIKPRVQSLLFNYGEYADKEHILEEYGIIKNPSYVNVKGRISIVITNQEIDIGKIPGGLAFSSESLDSITDFRVYGSKVVTIENLTSFHRYENNGEVIIYLGGYHNETKRRFLKKLYERNKGADYYHFGDIDIGGFYIYLHLKRQTGIPFKTMNMNVSTIEEHIDSTKPISANDKKRLPSLLKKMTDEGEDEKDIQTVRWIEKHNRKLEQEAI